MASSRQSAPASKGKSAPSTTSGGRGTRSTTSANSSGNRNRKSGDDSIDEQQRPSKQQQLVRVRSFTTKSGTVVNRGDSFKCRSGRGNQQGRTSASASQGGDVDSASSGRPARRSLPHPTAGWSSSEYFGFDDVAADPGYGQQAPGDYCGFGASWEVLRPDEDDVTADDGRMPYESCRRIATEPDDVALTTRLRGSDGRIHGESEVRGTTNYLQPSGLNSHRTLSAVGSCSEDEGGSVSPTVGGGGPLPYSVAVLGAARVGKTTLVEQLLTSEYLANKECNSPVDDVASDSLHQQAQQVTVQIDDEECTVRFNENNGGFTLDLRDGQKPAPSPPRLNRGRSLVGHDGFLVVYSVTDRSSFRYAQTCLQELRPDKRLNAVILVANKADVVRNRVISTSDGTRLASRRHCKFIEVSALLDHRMDELLVGIVRQIRLRYGDQPDDGSDADRYTQGDGGRIGRAVRATGNRLASSLIGAVGWLISHAHIATSSASGRNSATAGSKGNGSASHGSRLHWQNQRRHAEEVSNLFTK